MAAQSVLNPYNKPAFQVYGSIVIAAGTVSSFVTFTSSQSIGASSMLVYNESTKTVFVTSGLAATGTVTAVAAGTTESSTAIPVGAGAIMTLLKGNGNDTVAVIAPSANGNVYFSAGEGT